MHKKKFITVITKGRGKQLAKLPLVEGVLKYLKENNISFCMPGHKGGRGFRATPVGKELIENLSQLDITEVEGVDNLHNPKGIIKEAGQLLSDYYGSGKSYFLVNGSTSGNLSAIFSCFDEGDKIIIERNCHSSIFNAIVMRKLTPVYVKSKLNTKYNAPFSIDMEHFFKILNENKDAKGIIVTYPNYYGICCNLKLICENAKRCKMITIVDCAHGAHFGACSELPKNPLMLGADVAVMSAHKTLSAFNQTAFLHVSKTAKIDLSRLNFYVNAFTTTSPSYMLLCSLDYSRYYLEVYGQEEYSNLIEVANYYKKKINLLLHFHIIEHKDGIEIDPTRYVINVENGYSAYLFAKYLKENAIQTEMSDSSNVVLIFSPFNRKSEFEKLYQCIKNCDVNKIKENTLINMEYEIPQMILEPYNVLKLPKKWIEIEDCVGCISATNIIPYPPGIPLVIMGEKIENKCLNIVKYYMDRGKTVLGMKGKQIQVIDS
jgi:arginine/lysine/ornithine decarboxylase